MEMTKSVLKAIVFIEENLKENLTVKQVAEHVGYSQFYFSRQFTQLTRQSIYDYIIKRKVTQAKCDLLKTEKKIIDVALDYGFNSHEVFSRCFKKVYHCNPSMVEEAKEHFDVLPLTHNHIEFMEGLEIKVGSTDEVLFFEIHQDGSDYYKLGDSDKFDTCSLLSGTALSQPTSGPLLTFKSKQIIAVNKRLTKDTLNHLKELFKEMSPSKRAVFIELGDTFEVYV